VTNRWQPGQSLVNFGGQQPASLELRGKQTKLERRAGNFSDQTVSPESRLLVSKLGQRPGVSVQSVSDRPQSARTLGGC
jgi:hypothetical protein